MKTTLLLSYERVSADLMSCFDGVGLVRGEYVFRAEARYPGRESVARFLVPYLRHLGQHSDGRPVWYRTLEADTAECNTLAGVEEIIVEPDRLTGLRGIRRSRRFPGAFQAELEGVAAARAAGVNVGVVFPFVTYIDELEWAVGQVREVAADAPVATMVEVPSLLVELDRVLECGVSRLVVGCNDLSSLLLAWGRAVRGPVAASPPLVRAIEQIVLAAHRGGVEVAVAGYLHEDLMGAAEQAGADECVIHYSDLPRLYGARWAGLPDLTVLAETKAKTRAAIEKFNTEHDVVQRVY